MCLGIPLQIVRTEGILGIATDGTRTERVDLTLVGPQEPGTWILWFLGTAREVLDEAEALRIKAALAGLQALMRGEDPGDAFADLENREPQLPPHLIPLSEAQGVED